MADDPIDLGGGVALADIPVDGLLAGELDGAPLMLARWTDDAGREQVSALDALCTHRGAKLTTGLRTGDVVHCPFHHACFDLTSGEATVAPAIEPLRRWRVEVDGGTVRVSSAAPLDAPDATEPVAGVPQRVDDDRGVTRVVVIGGGAAGFATVEKLRREAFTGAITLVSGEPDLPVDRTMVSKDYLAGDAPAEKLPLKAAGWYAEHDVAVRLATRATALDLANRVVALDDGEELGYDALVLATGGEPKRPDLPGFDRDDVFVLRSPADADAIVAAAASGGPVVVVGSGFIGLETAASMRSRGLEVTVVAPSETPLASQLGAELGALVRSVHEENGVRFVTGEAVGWTGSELELADGSTVPAAFVVVGLGVAPRTELAEAAGLAVDDGVLVDAYGETAVRGVFAAGDIARFPDPLTGRPIRVEHWAQAERAGALAAVNLLGGQTPLTEPPYFWSKHFSLQIRMAGHAESTGDAALEGSLDDRKVVVRYSEDGRVTAVAGIGSDLRVLELERDLLREPAL